LRDILGNVGEWVADCWNDSYRGAPTDASAWTAGDCDRRVIRGGSWSSASRSARVAARDNLAAGSRINTVGFRVARTLP
jgi:formylglycine-generating enzyme required for sulfatase activity